MRTLLNILLGGTSDVVATLAAALLWDDEEMVCSVGSSGFEK